MKRKSRLLAGCFFGGVLTAVLGVQAAELGGADLEFWKLHWRSVAQSFTKVGQDFYACLDWDPRFPSSYRNADGERQGVDQWAREHADSQKVTTGGFSKVVKQVPLKEEAEAAVLSLPNLAVGQYGQIHSALVVEVVGPQEMVVRDVWALDTQVAAQRDAELEKADKYIKDKQAEYIKDLDKARRSGGKQPLPPPEGLDKIKSEIESHYVERLAVLKKQENWSDTLVKLVGFSTAGALPGRRWKPVGKDAVRVALVAEQELPSRSRAARMALVGVNADLYRSFLSEDDFKALLSSRSIDPVALVTESRQYFKDSGTDPMSDLRRQIVELIEKAKPDVVASSGSGAGPGRRIVLEPAGPDEADDWFIRRSGNSGRAPLAPAVPVPASPLPQL